MTFYLLWLLWYIAYNPIRIKKIPPAWISSQYGSIDYYFKNTFHSMVKLKHPPDYLGLGTTFSERAEAFLLLGYIYKN